MNNDSKIFMCQVLEQKVYENLSRADLVDVLASLKPADMEHCHLWLEGWAEWRPISTVDSFADVLSEVNARWSQKSRPLPPLPKVPKLVPPPPPSAKSSSSDYSEKRVHERHFLEAKVIVLCEGSSFKSLSKNISLGGMELSHSVPRDFLGKTSKVFITLGSGKGAQQIAFDAQLIADDRNAKRVKFLNPSAQFLSDLKVWIENSLSKKLVA